MKPEQERLVAVLKDTVSLLCKNSLTFEEQVVVQGVICITVDKQDVLVVPVHESIGQAEYEPCVACGHTKEAPPGSQQQNNSPRKRKRHRRSSSGGGHSPGSPATYDKGQREEDDEEDEDEVQQRVKIKKEEQEISDDEDLILIDEDIKREHNDSDMSYITGYMDNSQLSSITATPQQPHQQQQLQQQHFQGPSSWQSNPASSSAASQLEMPEGGMPDGTASSQKVQRSGSFMCPWSRCNKHFHWASHLKRHYRTHTGERPFKCLICPHSATSKFNLSLHIKLKHSEDPIDGRLPPRLECSWPGCLKSFPRYAGRTALTNHYRVHTGERPFQCSQCSYACNVKGNLMAHMKRKHPGINFVEANSGVE